MLKIVRTRLITPEKARLNTHMRAMRKYHPQWRNKTALWRRALIAAFFLSGCAGQYVPPLAINFGGLVTISEPGFTVPAKVVKTSSVSTPTLMVPAGSPLNAKMAPVLTQTGAKVEVPVVKAPEVSVPILAVPVK